MYTCVYFAMTWDADRAGRDADALSQFEKNRFFKGKLMTPHDMEAEQEYHARRLQTLTRFLDGTGVVSGLEVQSVTETDDGLEVTVGEGLALDGTGRPVVVEGTTTKSLPIPATDEISLYVQYAEVPDESVPVPDTDGAVDRDVVANRLVEVFELTHRETRPERDAPDRFVDLPEPEAGANDPGELAEALLEHHPDRDRSTRAEETPAVFLGTFERSSDGTWAPVEDAPGRPYVYDRDLLFGLLVGHLADTDNPHRTPVDERPEEPPDDIHGVTRRLTELETTVETIERERATLARYAVRKTTKGRVRFFTTLSERLEPQTGKGSRLAREIADFSRMDPDAGDVDSLVESTDLAGSFAAELEALLDPLQRLDEPLERVATDESHRRYRKAVGQLNVVVDAEEAAVLDLVDAHDRVCEAADSLDVLVDVVPDA